MATTIIQLISPWRRLRIRRCCFCRPTHQKMRLANNLSKLGQPLLSRRAPFSLAFFSRSRRIRTHQQQHCFRGGYVGKSGRKKRGPNGSTLELLASSGMACMVWAQARLDRKFIPPIQLSATYRKVCTGVFPILTAALWRCLFLYFGNHGAESGHVFLSFM